MFLHLHSTSFLSSFALPLDPLTLLQLVSELESVVDWLHLGLYLHIPEHELFSIEQYQRGHVLQSRTDMLNWWLQHGTHKDVDFCGESSGGDQDGTTGQKDCYQIWLELLYCISHLWNYICTLCRLCSPLVISCMQI